MEGEIKGIINTRKDLDLDSIYNPIANVANIIRDVIKKYNEKSSEKFEYKSRHDQ